MSEYDDFVESMWLTNDNPIKDEAHAVLGLSEEVAELVGKYIKALHTEIDLKELLSEMGDIMFYLTKVAHFNGYTHLDVAEFPSRQETEVDRDAHTLLDLVSYTGMVTSRYKRKYRVGDEEVTPESVLLPMRAVFRSLATLGFINGFCPGAIIHCNMDKLSGRHERGTLAGSGDDR